MRFPARRNSVSLLAAVTNQGAVRFTINRGVLTTRLVIVFMQRLSRAAGCKVFLFLDNLNVHKAKAVRDWVAAQCDVTDLVRTGSSNGVDMAYREFGTGEPVVLQQGFGNCVDLSLLPSEDSFVRVVTRVICERQPNPTQLDAGSTTVGALPSKRLVAAYDPVDPSINTAARFERGCD